jgi:hypothetical protein
MRQETADGTWSGTILTRYAAAARSAPSAQGLGASSAQVVLGARIKWRNANKPSCPHMAPNRHSGMCPAR